MSILSAPQQAANEKANIRTAYFLELQFAGGTSYLCSFDRSYTWGGHTWSGLGQIMALSPVENSEGTKPNPLRITLAVEPAWLAKAVGPVEEYRGKKSLMYVCPLDDNYRLIGTPQLAWRGKMDTVVIGIDGPAGSIVIGCETAVLGLRRRSSLRLNAAQHKARYPGETGFDYLVDLLANPQTWISKKFMAR